MKKVFIAAALLCGFATISFAGTPKSDSKSETPAKSESKSGESLYWYRVTYDAGHTDGYIPSGTPLYVQAEEDAVESPCDPGDNSDCLRGFPLPLNGAQNTSTNVPKITKD